MAEREFVVKEWRDDKGILHIKEVGQELVRCKECIHNPWDFDRTDYTCVWDDDFADRPQTPNDFCSYGERKEDKE